MNTFQTLYGFARNISFIAAIGAINYASRALRMGLSHGAERQAVIVPLIVTAFVSLMMFYRYLHFY